MQKIETYPLPDRATFQERFAKSNIPCKFEMPAPWGAHKKWSLEWLKENFGYLDVSPILYNKDDFYTKPETARLLLGEYISALLVMALARHIICRHIIYWSTRHP